MPDWGVERPANSVFGWLRRRSLGAGVAARYVKAWKLFFYYTVGIAYIAFAVNLMLEDFSSFQNVREVGFAFIFIVFFVYYSYMVYGYLLADNAEIDPTYNGLIALIGNWTDNFKIGVELGAPVTLSKEEFASAIETMASNRSKKIRFCQLRGEFGLSGPGDAQNVPAARAKRRRAPRGTSRRQQKTGA